jgi:dihydrofolate reductase
MRKLIESALITLNGAITNQAKWAADYFDDEAKTQGIAKLKECDLFLLGRVTYEQFAPRWSQMSDDPYFATINAMRKVVVSNTLKTATWNAEVLRGDAAEQIRILKEQPGKPDHEVRCHFARPDVDGTPANRRVSLFDLSGHC